MGTSGHPDSSELHRRGARGIAARVILEQDGATIVVHQPKIAENVLLCYYLVPIPSSVIVTRGM